MNSASSNHELTPLLEYFHERLFRIFAYHLSVLHFERDHDLHGNPLTNGRTFALQIIQNACLHESLSALRDLDDFFSPSKQGDDLRAAAFGYPNTSRFLSDAERRAISKSVVHSTFPGMELQNMRWDLWEIVSKCVIQCEAFFVWATENDQSNVMFGILATIGVTRLKQVYSQIAQDELVPGNWTTRIVNPKSGERSACQKRDVSTVQS